MITLAGSLETQTGEWLFKGIELSLFAKGWTCLLGPSGVGKTTILRLIAGLETHGTFNGSITGKTGKASMSCAYMAQQDLLMPWLNVIDNVCLGARLRGECADRKRAADLVDRVGLSGHQHKVPNELSGGMRQRAALARTLMEDQELVLLDEPFSALDARTRAEMQELAHELLQNRSVLLVTHDPAEAARLGDRIVILDENGLRETDSKKQRSMVSAEASSTLKLQSRLLSKLRERAS